MAHKVTDISRGGEARYAMLSQTPKDRSRDNWFLKELQDKYDAEWRYAPNVVTVEYEKTWGKEDFDEIEVRDQKVHSDKNKTYSDDVKRLVFRDLWEKRFRIGSKFRFSEKFDMDISAEKRNVWLATNASYSSPGTSVVVTRCNGRLGSMHSDAQGVSQPHYEPVIFGGELKGVSVYDSQTAFSPESELTAVMQHNAYTAQYYINQRFVIGYDQTYRVKGLNKFYSQTTNDPHDPGLMILYLEITERSEKDDFDTGIAYNETHDVVMEPAKGSPEDFSILWKEPLEIPSSVPSEPTRFVAVAQQGGAETGAAIEFSFELENLPEGVDPGRYVGFEVDGNSFTVWKKRPYLNGNFRIKASIPASKSSGDDGYSVAFSMRMGGL